MQEEPIGKVTHFFKKISVAVVALDKDIKLGDNLHFVGVKTDFEQKLDSMQIEYNHVEKASKGDSIGLKTEDKTREGDIVYKVS